MAALIDAGQIQFTYKHLPVVGQESQWAAEATECAADQGKFWAYHDLLYKNQKGENQGAFSVAKLKGFAGQLGLDAQKFNGCLDTHQYANKVKDEGQEGRALKLPGTPSYVIDGQVLQWNNLNDIVNAVKRAVNSK